MTPLDLMKDDRERFDSIAKDAGTSPAYFEQVARKYRSASVKLGKKLVKASDGFFTLSDVVHELDSDIEADAA